MPRHRIEAPRQRTLWRTAEQSARRVRFLAAGRRETPGHAKPAVAPQWRQRLTRNQRRRLNRAGRRLLVSPWFAAGAGVVIATGVIIYTPPHAKLDPAISITRCKQSDCESRQVTPQAPAPGLPAGTGGGRVTAPSTPRVPAGMTFSYQPPVRSAWDGFSMWITIRVPQGLGEWKVSFVIPGATGVYVYGSPRAQPFGTDGVTVSSSAAGTEAAGYARIAGHQSVADGGASWNGYTVQFQVRGKGTPRAPSQCLYNSAAVCQFKQAPSTGATSWPGSV